MKQKICKNSECKVKFMPERDFEVVCSFECALIYSKQLIDKREAKKKTNARIKLREYKKNDKPILLQLAQKLVNKYIRLRDKNNNCISCNHDFKLGRQVHAGHYIARSKSSLLRFDESNIHSQCSICNDILSGNVNNYRIGLIKKIGIDKVEYLEENATSLKTWTIEDLQEIIKIYREKIKKFSE